MKARKRCAGGIQQIMTMSLPPEQTLRNSLYHHSTDPPRLGEAEGGGSAISEPHFVRGYDIPSSRFITKPRSAAEHQRGESEKQRHNNNTRWEEPGPPRSLLLLGRHGCLNVFK